MDKVLIVDDEEDMIWSLQKNLPNDTLQVKTLTASSGEEALETLKKTSVDLIVTDIKMPGMSGLDLLTEVNNNYPHLGVVVMTAYPSQEWKTETLLRKGLSYIEKPFDMSEMRKVISRALKEKKDKLAQEMISGIQLSDILQLNCLTKTTAALKIKASDGDGVVYVVGGNIVHAVCDNLKGEKAFYRILELERGRIDSMKNEELPDKTINKSFKELFEKKHKRRGDGRGDKGIDVEELLTLDISPPKPTRKKCKTPARKKPKNVQTVLSDEGDIEDSIVDALLGLSEEIDPGENMLDGRNLDEETQQKSDPERNKPTKNKPERNKPEKIKLKKSDPEDNKPEENAPEESKSEDDKLKESKPEESKPVEIKLEKSSLNENKLGRNDPDENMLDGAVPDEDMLEIINPEKINPEKINFNEEENMAELQELLTEFTNIPGVNTVCLVGRDGFLLDSMARNGTETEMIGAIASSGFGASESMGNQLAKGDLSMTMIEYRDGPVMLSPVGSEAFLVVVADKESNLGMIRLKIKKFSPDILEAAAL